ncbi:MAG: hypothetical protein IKA26_02570 [Alistipes sp.]|nr:hypothetical protein [Alistipes sp.]
MRRFLLALAALFLLYGESYACTSAIVAASRSSEGVPMLWKHRDNTFSNTRVDYVTGGKYAYTALVPNTRRWSRGSFAGINEVGLGTITTATNKLPVATKEEWLACPRRRIGRAISVIALRECATVDEVEELLRTTKRGLGSKSNLGVADATGAVAYFEIWDLGYRRYDADKRADGFDVRANFSHARTVKSKGASVRRYNLIMKEMRGHKGAFTPQQLIGYSRSYNSLKYGNVLATNDRYICQNHTVPRYSTVGAIVLVCDGNNPRMLVMNGHSVSSVAVPVYVKAKRNIPQCVKGDAMRLLSEDFRAKAYYSPADGIRILNKELVGRVLKIKQPKIEMPKEMPADITAFNARIDALFAKHEKRVRKVLSKY